MYLTDNGLENPQKWDLDPVPILCPNVDLDPNQIKSFNGGSRSKSRSIFQPFFENFEGKPLRTNELSQHLLERYQIEIYQVKRA